jgi:2-polyprenyl-3-methyl-5-hydroxy-6-metoxy-1,4-benzoquinol methylase
MTGTMEKKTTQFAETGRWGREWQRAPGWESHTILRIEADRLAAGYVRFLQAIVGERRLTQMKALGIGSGAGHLEAALIARGVSIEASEWSDDGIRLIQSENPDTRCRKVDLMSFDDVEAWDMIVCRELYPFTRTNAFSQQFDLIARLIDALRPGGVLLLSGSDVAWPDCMDYARMMRTLRADCRVADITGPVLEPVLKRVSWNPAGILGLRLVNIVAEVALASINRLRGTSIAGIRLYAIRKTA